MEPAGVTERHIFSVSEVNQIIRDLLDGEPVLRQILVRGEVSNFKTYPSGHLYFTLKDAEGAIRCVMFKGQASRLRFRPENGMRVLVEGRVSVFPRDGAYQLYCNTLTPEGAGDLAVAFEQLKAKLYGEGLFDEAHKQPLPLYPRRIAIITSSAGAAVHDMIRILRRRFPIAKVILLPVRVQGAEAPPEIAGAIRYANRYQVGDVIITGRGGGSMEDLWAFNDERVARAIYESRIPVISAVGHEPDVTISDFVADVRASTPSNAAEIVVPDQAELLRWFRQTEARMARAETGRLQWERKRLAELSDKRVLRERLAYLQDKRMLLVHMQRRMGDVADALLARRRQKFSALSAALDAMSPLKVLSRGYAMAQNRDGQILKQWQDVKSGEPVSVLLGAGGFLATVDAPFSGDAPPWEESAEEAVPPKKKRGRPRKNPPADADTIPDGTDASTGPERPGGAGQPEGAETPEPPKRKRGRPRKTAQEG